MGVHLFELVDTIVDALSMPGDFERHGSRGRRPGARRRRRASLTEDHRSPGDSSGAVTPPATARAADLPIASPPPVPRGQAATCPRPNDIPSPEL